MQEEVSRGAFGLVYHVVNQLTGEHYAMKALGKSQVSVPDII